MQSKDPRVEPSSPANRTIGNLVGHPAEAVGPGTGLQTEAGGGSALTRSRDEN
jgi:hypothetical protein